MEFLWHAVSEKEKKEIQIQAKSILDNFSKKLSKINQKLPESTIERKDCEREENTKTTNDFSRKIMFENAPEKNENFIKAERKTW